ncbi:hypothetical protein N7516_007684 [Penicillium verrucosum]|uniref:uncharacterized protein n=1 Tax=Penicillium verrucosum TaxID=60171 RepID=UPI002545533E|nr:uncharacterized protein N7516_007684 [Penicillium verrucosum]KAJ5933195.1 hypothetical protein N7516_007684 [Penicillium verrucosum]
MASNRTCPVCSACPDPKAWKGQLIDGLLGMGLWTMVWIIRFHALQVRLKDSQMIIKMASNGTCLVCPICPDPKAWKGQLIGGLLGMLALGLVLGTVVWIVWFHALQVRLKDPQMIIRAEYEEEKRAQRPPWWRFWKGE